jgi:recombination protein U
MTNYANRGMQFEEFVEYANARYRHHGIAVVEKQHTNFIPIRNRYGKVISCKVEQKATVDFMGRYRNIPVAIEAKNTNSDRIRFSEVKDHQAQFLNDFVGEHDLGFGAVLVSFNMRKFFLVPWHFWAAARDMWEKNRGEKAYVIEYGMSWQTPGKASVSADELLPEWEVKPNNKYGLAYLSKIDTYMNNYVKE